jgi:hypothetical protein
VLAAAGRAARGRPLTAKLGQLGIGVSEFANGADTHAAFFARGPIRGNQADNQGFDSGQGRRG